MALAPILPKPAAPVVTAKGLTTAEWYDFFRLLASFAGDNLDVQAEIEALAARVAALESDSDLPTLTGPASVRVVGTLAGALVQFFLDGDQAEPGNTYYYGTGPTGTKGFFTVASTLAADDYVVFTVGDDGVTTIHGLNPYADYLTDPDGNPLQSPEGDLLQADDGFPIALAYGGTGGDYATVAANLVWASPNGAAGAPVFRTLVADDLPAHNALNGLQGGTAGEFYHLTSAQQVDVATLSTGGTTGQFWRGDQAYSDTLRGTFAVVLDGSGTGQTLSRFSADSTGFQIRCIKGRGSEASPGTVQSADTLFSIQARGYDNAGTPAQTGNVGDIAFDARENFTTAAQGTRFFVRTVANGSTTLGVRLQVDSAQVAPGATNTITSGAAALRWSQSFQRDLIVGSATASLGGGVGLAFFSNATTVPTSNPSGGGLLYAEGGAGKWRGSSGTVTTFAAANPHCPVCGSDFVHEWDNPAKYGYLAVCMNCHCNGINSHTRTRGAWNLD